MEIDDPEAQSLKQKAEALHRLSSGPLSSSISKLAYSSRAIPSDKDFHFFYNFDEFKSPVREIAGKSRAMLESVGSAAHVWGKTLAFPEDVDDGHDWLVNVNDELFERFDVAAEEFQSSRKKEEEGARAAPPGVSGDGFQLVCGKKKKGLTARENPRDGGEGASGSGGGGGVRVASRDKKVEGGKPKVPFHIPSIPRPQDLFNILVNNSNQPFQHVWLQKSDDDTRFVHPLEHLSVLDFVDKGVENIEPVKPPPVELTPFKLVEEVKDLKEMAAKLRTVDEFAVDLEHNQYRSFQGMTCLMQISTRSEDFVIDTLKLRVHVGPYLREVFKDPSKKKVMHGSDKDILWLQRDFGIYICNLFDTGQASRVLKLERNSLEYLLHHFCGVNADKEYQNADWRLRPLPYEMLKYAREDTHYLLHIFDLMRIKLLSESTVSENSDGLLVEVYKRSYDLCMQLYEKELLTENTYLHIYGLRGADFNAQQLSVVAGLYEWRDVVARGEDESTGYILPNRTLLEIAKQMPVTSSKLRRLLKTKHPYVERNLGSVVNIIRLSIQNASAFIVAAEQLKELKIEKASEEPPVDTDGSESFLESSTNLGSANAGMENINSDRKTEVTTAPTGENGQADSSKKLNEEGLASAEEVTAEIGRDGQEVFSNHVGENEKVQIKMDCDYVEQPGHDSAILGQNKDTSNETIASPLVKDTGATVQLLKKPSRAFGALLGNSVTKRKSDLDTKHKDQMKLEQIKSTVNLPFYTFAGSDIRSNLLAGASTKVLEPSSPEDSHPVPADSAGLEEIVILDGSADAEKSGNGNLDGMDERLEQQTENQESASELDQGDELMSLSDLSSSFKKCFQSLKKSTAGKQAENSHESHGILQLKPFDYEAARKEFRFGEKIVEESSADGNEDHKSARKSGGRRKNLAVGKDQGQNAEGTAELPQGKRRLAFPASGNRSATFR